MSLALLGKSFGSILNRKHDEGWRVEILGNSVVTIPGWIRLLPTDVYRWYGMREHVVPASTTPQYRAYTRTHQPLALHPQFEVITVPSASDGSLTSGATEYRVYNFRRWRTGRIVRGDGWGGLEVACITLLVVGPCTAQVKRGIYCSAYEPVQGGMDRHCARSTLDKSANRPIWCVFAFRWSA